MTLDDNKVEALTSRCLLCAGLLEVDHRVCSAYHVKDIQSFEKQIELGIIGQQVRNYWTHVECKNPKLQGFNLLPDIHHCIRCNRKLSKEDVVSPVFRVEDPEAVNPSDPTDKGISFADRVYFMHANCETEFSPILQV